MLQIGDTIQYYDAEGNLQSGQIQDICTEDNIIIGYFVSNYYGLLPISQILEI